MSAKKSLQKRADELVRIVFDAENLEELVTSQIPPFDDFSPKHAARIIDGGWGGTNIVQMVERWRTDDIARTHAGGRPSFVSLRAVLILKLMHAIARKPMTIKQLAETVSFALSPEQMDLIGLVDDGADTDSWYQRIDSANRALLRLVDPYPFPRYRRSDPSLPAIPDRINRHRILKGAQRQKLDSSWKAEPERIRILQERLDDLNFEINANVIQSVRPLLARFSGDIALDATYTKVDGHQSPENISLDARSVIIEAGLWMRGGNHGVDEATAKKRKHAIFKYGFETDFVTMTLGPEDDSPELILAMNLHRPGSGTHVAQSLFPRIKRLGLPTGTIAVDRLYNDGQTVEDFHLPLLQHGYEFVFDYRDKQLGPKASFSHNGVDYMIVDGTWYLAAMPDDLAFAAYNHRLPVDDDNYIDSDTLARQIAARRPYQLKRHGSRQADGYQRYSLPDPTGYPPIIDFDTGEVHPKPTNKTVTIPGSLGLKWEQKYPFLSPEWTAAYNRRSAVERKNSQLKQGTTTDLNNADNRPQRSYASNALSVALLISAHNLVISQEYITKMAGKNTSKGRTKRTSKREDKLKLPSIAKQKDGRTRPHIAA